MNSRIFLFLLSALSLFSCNNAGKFEVSEARELVFILKRDFIINDTSLKVKPAFIPLYPGAAKPEGWLKDWAVAASRGITGHLDEWSIAYNMAWKGVGFEAEGVDPETGMGWPLEQCSYWLDGAVRLAYILNDSLLIKKTTERLDLVAEGVLNGGKSFIYWQDVDFNRRSFDNWAHSHMGRALVAYYEATGNPRILEALVKVYSHFELVPIPFQNHGVSGCTNVDPMLAVYELSGERKILDAVLTVAGDSLTKETIGKWNKQDIMNGHGVISYENFRIPAMIYPYTRNTELLQATRQCFLWLDENHLQPHGVASSEEHTAGKGSTRNTETCNVAAAAWSYQQLYEITGEGEWGDKIEKIFFNAAPVPVSRDFMTMSYYQSPNRIENLMPYETPGHPLGESAYVYRPTGHSVLCCSGNLNRVIPNYIMHLWMATTDRGIAASLYAPNTVDAIAGENVPVRIKTQTTYPFGETISMTVDPAKSCRFPLYLRIPEWCKQAKMQLNGKPVNIPQLISGFAKIERKWEKGDLLELTFPMQVEVCSGKETPYPQTGYFLKGSASGRPLARETNITGSFRTIAYGPLLFALPVKDINPNQQAEGEKWNYALLSADGTSIEVQHSEMPAHWKWEIEETPVKLIVKARTFDWKPTSILPIPESEVEGTEDTDITLVPYGCTKFRISMFPVVKNQ